MQRLSRSEVIQTTNLFEKLTMLLTALLQSMFVFQDWPGWTGECVVVEHVRVAFVGAGSSIIESKFRGWGLLSPPLFFVRLPAASVVFKSVLRSESQFSLGQEARAMPAHDVTP